MSPLKPDTNSPEKDLSLNLGKWGSRLAVLFILKGWLAGSGCAATSQVKPNAEARDADPKQTLLRAIQAAEDGAQPDGSEVQFGDGATKEEAVENAKALVSILLEGNLVFESHSTALPNNQFLAVARGKTEKKTGPNVERIKKSLLKKCGAVSDGAQPNGSEVQFGEGATIKEAADNAKAVIQILLDSEAINYTTHSERMGDKWIAVVKGIAKNPTTRHADQPEKKEPSKKELARFYAELDKHKKNETQVEIREGIKMFKTFLRIDQECIDHYVKELEKGPFAGCIGRALKRNPDRDYSGEMEVFVRVNNQGKVYRVNTRMKTKGFTPQEEKKIERCVIGNVKRWPLPEKPKGKRDQRKFSFKLYF